jgi:hypothetical protein
MSKNDWLDALNRETRENAEFAYLWCMSKIRVECSVNTYPACKVEDALAVASVEFQKATKARRKTRNASANRSAREDAMRSCGLTKCIGSVSGKVYWE